MATKSYPTDGDFRFEAKHPHWGFPVFAVAKKGGKFRMVTDFRLLNDACKFTSLPLSNVESLLACLFKTHIYAVIDLMKGFNSLPVDEESQNYFVLVTPFGNYIQKVAPMGWLNSPPYFQDRVSNEVIASQHMTDVLLWIDDLLCSGTTEKKFLDCLGKLLKSIAASGFKINVDKVVLYTKTAIWAGRHINNGRINYEKRFYKKLIEWHSPVVAGELSQFIYAMTWIRKLYYRFRQKSIFCEPN
mmetsp:Transcript_10647/g.13332  ORF Transcript_10647/g.13332 Transcript_10647/m.13332 type:complete len:244 (-) Transcript_10647:575-1306(-)